MRAPHGDIIDKFISKIGVSHFKIYLIIFNYIFRHAGNVDVMRFISNYKNKMGSNKNKMGSNKNAKKTLVLQPKK